MKEALKLINRGTDEILTESDLKKKLDSGKQLIIMIINCLPESSFFFRSDSVRISSVPLLISLSASFILLS